MQPSWYSFRYVIPSDTSPAAAIHRALTWILKHGSELGVRIVSLSASGDPVSPLAGNTVDEAVSALVEAGISVVAAAVNGTGTHLRWSDWSPT